MLNKITPLILTYNEAPNIERSLQKLTWAKRIVIIDSYSTDQTLEILKAYPTVEVFQRKFDSFAQQCNHGLSKVESPWVLSLDADYVLSEKLIEELSHLSEQLQINGYEVRFKYCVFGKPLSGTLLPPRKVLYRRERAVYVNDGHAHRVSIQGCIDTLQSPMYHDDRKPLSRWLWAQDRYMLIEAKKLLESPDTALSLSDRLRKRRLIAPFVVLIYCLLLKKGIFDGWRGWYYAFQRMFAEILLSLRMIEIATR
ncbi:MAG: glycosyltransferase family 2 protein [Cyanobacteria bacterium J06623_5]